MRKARSALKLVVAASTGAVVAGTAVSHRTGEPQHGAPIQLDLAVGTVISERQAVAHGLLTVNQSSLPGGGTLYSYSESDTGSSTVSVPIPPAGFQPLDATSAQLEEYGFPQRPASPGGALTNWLTAMAAFKYRAVPNFDLTVQPNGFDCGESCGSTFSGWSGYAAENSSGGDYRFTAVEGSFTVPSINSSYCPDGSEYGAPGVALWTGIGGAINYDDLMQNGIEYNFSGQDSPPSSQTDWTAWYYDIPISTQTGVLPATVSGASDTITAGDSIYLQTGYESSPGLLNFTTEDTTTGQNFYYQKNVSSSDWDPTSVEWITEEPAPFPVLPKFSTFGWTGAEGEYLNGSWKTITATAHGQTHQEFVLGPIVNHQPVAMAKGPPQVSTRVVR